MKVNKRKAIVNIFLDTIRLSRKVSGKFYVECLRSHHSEKLNIVTVKNSNIITLHASVSLNCTFKVITGSKVLSKILKINVYQIVDKHPTVIGTYEVDIASAYYEIVEESFSQSTSLGLMNISIGLTSNTAIKIREKIPPKILGRVSPGRIGYEQTKSMKIEEKRVKKLETMLEEIANSNNSKITDFHPISVTAITIMRSNDLMKTTTLERIIGVIRNYMNYNTESKIIFLIILVHLLTIQFETEDKVNNFDVELRKLTVSIFNQVINEVIVTFKDSKCSDIMSFFNEIGTGVVCRPLFTAILTNFASESGLGPGSFCIRESRYIQCMNGEKPRIASLKQVLFDLRR